ncbi:Hsp20/alpha crystallin family protein [bacterium]|nr:Hsp20/alpha crystallin family protein [bacterium]
MTTLSLWNDKPFLKSFFGSDLDTWDREAAFLPPCDIEEKDNFFLVSMDIPGMKKEELHIEVDNDILTISGERKQETATKQDGFRRTERFVGKFQRAFSLGETIDSKRIEASYEDGVLKLKLPREKVVKPEIIKIKVGEKISDTH